MPIDETKLQEEIDALDFGVADTFEDDDESSDDNDEMPDGDSDEDQTTEEEEESEETSEEEEEKVSTDITTPPAGEGSIVTEPTPPVEVLSSTPSEEQLSALSELTKAQQELLAVKKELASVQPKEGEAKAEDIFKHEPKEDYLEGEDLYEITKDPEKFNKFMANFERRTVEQAYTAFLNKIPEVTAHQVERHKIIDTTVNSFYADNEDLASIKPYVAQVAQQIASEDPALSLPDLLKQAASKTREFLKMPVPGPVVPNATDDDAFDGDKQSITKPKKGGKRKSKLKISALQSELDEL